MWCNIIKTSEEKQIQPKLKKNTKSIEKVSTINTPEDYFEVQHSGDLIDSFICLENYFDENIISILNKNGVKKEYDFIELIKNNISLNTKNYNNFKKLLESDEEFSDDDIICK